ncbi:hypothetical protein [Bacteriophage sp.]|nr:hypothetical protein [Caudoviricetes sp.]UOF80003.1 hypothetical protein [Bacteriophage sp.]
MPPRMHRQHLGRTLGVALRSEHNGTAQCLF